jgi:ATP-dependent helicase/nuclease subunit A
VARGYHRQFQHVLVDEYQDINEVQDAILNLVSRECLGDGAGLKQNLFCVGDVKQSIYRFRLAEPERFLRRYERFKLNGGGGGEVIDLQANFRSRGPLLEILNQLFTRLMTKEAMDIEYDASHHLRARAEFPAADAQGFIGAPVELHLLPEEVESDGEDDEPLDRSEREAQFVARRIKEIMGDHGGSRRLVADKAAGTPGQRPIEYRDIVILLRSMKFKADQYADALVAAGIPVHRDSGQGYFQSMEVRDMRTLLTLLDNPRQDIPMAAVLRSPITGLPEAEDCLARIRMAYPNNKEKTSLAFHQAVALYAKERDDELAAGLRDFLRNINTWRQLARHRPLAELIWEIYDQTGYLAFCEGLSNGPQRVANLIDLHQRAAQFGSFSRQGLYRFLKFLDSLEAETDFGQPSVLSQAANVVRIMSVHHSKGLEFPVVFLPELGKKINLQDTQGAVLVDKRAGIGLLAVDAQKRIRYPSLASVLVQNSLRQQSLAEELRVLYVATTRAKEHLILSGTCTEKKRDEWTTRWSRHSGAMPAQELLGVETMLDWVGPAVAMIGGENAFDITAHSAEEVRDWVSQDVKRPPLSPLQEKLARLEPLKPTPAIDELAQRVIDSLGNTYPHLAATRLEAARSVTDWTKQGRAAPVGYETAREKTITFERTLATARCLLGQDDLSAADIGTATHAVLQSLDFSRSCIGDDLTRQIESMVARRLLTQVQAKRVDQAAIEWFVKSELGTRMREKHGELRREVPFYLAVAPSEFSSDAASADLLDQVMIRGRIDAMLVGGDELTIVDYKTDRVTSDKVPERAAFYAGQVSLYRRALARITGKKVEEVYLVFLAARTVISV